MQEGDPNPNPNLNPNPNSNPNQEAIERVISSHEERQVSLVTEGLP